MFLGLSFAAWFVIFVVVLVFVLQICTKLPSDFVFLGGMGLLLVSGVIPVTSVIGSFSSTTVVLIGALFVVVCGLVQTGFLQWVVRYCLGSPTYMIVYGPGGYRFADFTRIGLPMNFIILAANIFITLILFPL